MLKSLWHYRHFIFSSVKNDYKSRLSRSKIGFLWLFLQPLAMALIYALILSNLVSAKLPGVDTIYAYPIYLLAGILAWTIIAETLSRSVTMFIDHAAMIQKMALPKILIPAIVAGQALVQTLLLFAAILLVVLAIGHDPVWQWLWLLPLIGLTLLLTLSIGLILGTLNVFIRDIGQAVPVFLQFGFWLTPIVYTLTIIPESYRHWFELNPLVDIVSPFQQILLWGQTPILSVWIELLLATIFFMLIGLLLFRRASMELVDEL